ncbi:type IV pilin-like G/H family protein [Chlorogloea sp. CCALA 695]|uniref:type IV pilin-like G/H family protein n=1 Tax=Chlorogloea sp. CCALA 695 TaxID=2107693 RepID=UPI000D05110D|nr:type IV pilin-like G/H family protein [Chlorogloea sp. CCALA 695]PSB35538.1 general secretion pathway protein GspH [Chlorogloea sp. CCALA 695]
MKAQIAAKYIQFLSNKKANKNSGFTLIELLVVIIIIGILSAIALPSFLNQAAKARASEARTNVGAVNRSQQAYYLENQAFVASVTADNGAPAALGLGVNNTPNYSYSSVLDSTTGVFNYGTPGTGKTDLKAYVGGVLRTANTTTISNLCETLASTTAAAAPPVLNPTANANAGSVTCVAASTKPLN